MKKVTYGIDAPAAIRSFITIICVSIGLSIPTIIYLSPSFPRISIAILTVTSIAILGSLYSIATLIFGSKVRKLRERDWLFHHLSITGTEKILDVGCGQGLLAIAAAKKLHKGSVTGIDIWSGKDQTNNSPATTQHNAQQEGVADKITLVTAPAQAMPFAKESFDTIISSWALHNIPSQEERQKALDEIDRVLKPKGQIAIMDIYYTQTYLTYFTQKGYTNLAHLGPRYTFGGPTYLVRAHKTPSTSS